MSALRRARSITRPGRSAGLLRRAIATPRGSIGLGLTLLVVLIAALGPAFAPHSATESLTVPFTGPSGSLPLGSDVLGRDVLSRVLDGGWQLLLIAAAATALGVGTGVGLGLVAAYLRSWPDGVIMRLVDVVLAFPPLVFALLLVSVAGAQIWLIIVAVGVSHAPQVARVVRAGALDVCERDYIKAAELFDASRLSLIFGDVLPNVMPIVMVELGLRFTYSILIIASMSFLGFGLQPPDPNWGLMINENRIGLVVNPWAVVAPAGLIALLTIGTNTLTDAIARVALGVDRPADAPAETVAAAATITAPGMEAA